MNRWAALSRKVNRAKFGAPLGSSCAAGVVVEVGV